MILGVRAARTGTEGDSETIAIPQIIYNSVAAGILIVDARLSEHRHVYDCVLT